MLSYCFKHRKNTDWKNPEVKMTKNGNLMLLSKCAVFNNRKSRLIKEQEESTGNQESFEQDSIVRRYFVLSV